jgi:hypothetical protein
MKKLCLFYGNCQVIYYLNDILKSIDTFNENYDTITYVNHDRDNIILLMN